MNTGADAITAAAIAAYIQTLIDFNTERIPPDA